MVSVDCPPPGSKDGGVELTRDLLLRKCVGCARVAHMPTDTTAADHGPEIRDMRARHGITAPELARHADVSLSHLTRFETGERPISTDAYNRLVDALALLMLHKASA